MTMAELSIIAKYNLNIKVVILDNKYLGMVRQWQNLFFDDRQSGVSMTHNPEFTTLAKAYSLPTYLIKTNNDLSTNFEDIILSKGPVVVHAEVIKEDNVFPMIPAGGTIKEMVITSSQIDKNKKPRGST
jgi:acetolactate synthase-1/2/3 large subunit